MSCEEAVVMCTDVVYVEQKRSSTVSSAYRVDFWRELRKRWMVVGVLCAVALAVLSPELGAPGGKHDACTNIDHCALHTQYLCYLPLTYIYYSAGASSQARALLAGARERARAHVLCCVHAHVVAPAMCAAVVTAFRDGVDYRIVKGAMLSSVCGGCAWLPLALRGGAAATAAAASGAVSLLVAPLLCGFAPAPPLSGVLAAGGSTLAPFAAGLWRGARGPRGPRRLARLAALALLYAECCERLSAAAGVLRVSDVLATLALVSCWLWLVAAGCLVYARSGLLSEADSRLVLVCGLPKSLQYWQGSAACCLAGLARLPAALLAPAQALLLAALVTDDHEDDPTTDVLH